MPAQQPSPTIQNHFLAGLKTEFTGLNFPENAATDTQNCVYSLIGDVTRRGGINYEFNNIGNEINAPACARNDFIWPNAGGDGQTQVWVQQIGHILYFYLTSNVTTGIPLSRTLLPVTVDINTFVAPGTNTLPAFTECQFAQGNGYLFVFHPNCSPFYCIYDNGNITATAIDIQIRDFVGVPDGLATSTRPNTLSPEHNYNLLNQGWGASATTSLTTWSGSGSYDGSIPVPGQAQVFPISTQSANNVITNGQTISITFPSCAGTGGNPHVNGQVTITGTVIAYNVSSVTITCGTNSNPQLNTTGEWAGGNFSGGASSSFMSLISAGFIGSWNAAISNYPSNADIWWLYKDSTGIFNPSATIASVQLSNAPAPKGSIILDAFNQQRGSATGLNITSIVTAQRPGTGAFYASRVFYAGVDDSQQATGDEPYTTWTENIYFSQIVVDQTAFGKCYQTNDPTDQNFFALLPSDGGVITIPGCGAVYKLFALRFGLLVFAANGIWFISGSTGIGFTASDYTVTKISNIRSISGTSYIDVQGYPFFWNQEGIYQVTPSSQPGSAHSPDIQLDVQNISLGTILTYYDNIPLISKVYARGDYDMLNFVVQWCFKATPENSISDRYNYDTILAYNVVTKAFYPYTLPLNESFSTIVGMKYLQNPGTATTPDPIFKYVTAAGAFYTFSEENDFTRWVDFFSENNIGYNYTSYFVTGYSLPGQGLRKIQTPYVYMFSRNPNLNSYGIRAVWDYAGSPTLGQVDALSGKWSTRQIITNNSTDFTMIYRKIRLRGRGLAVQIRVDSQPGLPFDIMGWSVWNEVNTGI